MPIHGYECRKCKREFEVFYSTHSSVEREEKTEKCPSCGSLKKKKLPPKGTSFTLKGKGWARDGYR